MDRHLLTPKEVASLLNISIRTVYDHRRDLGGFFPAGIGRLRFSPGVIYGIMEGQEAQDVAVQFPIQRGNIHRERVRKQKGCRNGPVIAPASLKEAERADRHGIFALVRSLPKGRFKTNNRHDI
jgi:hypothetical protein